MLVFRLNIYYLPGPTVRTQRNLKHSADEMSNHITQEDIPAHGYHNELAAGFGDREMEKS